MLGPDITFLDQSWCPSQEMVEEYQSEFTFATTAPINSAAEFNIRVARFSYSGSYYYQPMCNRISGGRSAAGLKDFV